MSVTINISGSVASLVVNTNRQGASITANGDEVWSAGPKPSKFVFTFSEATTQTIYFTQSVVNAVTWDWGDGSQTETSADTTATLSHSFAAGTYTVRATCASGETWSPGQGGTSTNFTAANATYPNTTLKSVVLRDGVEAMATAAFMRHGALETAELESVQTMANTTFNNCTSLKIVTLGASVTSIGNGIFVSDSSMQELTCKATTPPTIVAGSISGLPADCDIFVPSASVSTYQAASGWSDRAAYIQAIPA